MSNISVVFYSGYGHTKVIAQTFAQEIGANLVAVSYTHLRAHET